MLARDRFLVGCAPEIILEAREPDWFPMRLPLDECMQCAE